MSQIKIPTNAEEARTMTALGIKWLEGNAPDQLTQHWRDMKAEAGYRAYVHCLNHWSTSIKPSAFAGLAKDYADSIRKEK